jgi:hypothetical protein
VAHPRFRGHPPKLIASGFDPSVVVGDGRRITPAPGPVVTGNGPEVSFLGASEAGIEHRNHGLVDSRSCRSRGMSSRSRRSIGMRLSDPPRISVQHKSRTALYDAPARSVPYAG